MQQPPTLIPNSSHPTSSSSNQARPMPSSHLSLRPRDTSPHQPPVHVSPHHCLPNWSIGPCQRNVANIVLNQLHPQPFLSSFVSISKFRSIIPHGCILRCVSTASNDRRVHCECLRRGKHQVKHTHMKKINTSCSWSIRPQAPVKCFCGLGERHVQEKRKSLEFPAREILRIDESAPRPSEHNNNDGATTEIYGNDG